MPRYSNQVQNRYWHIHSLALMTARPTATNKLFAFVARKRFALAVLVLLASSIILVSEQTYRDTTATLRDGISLTDARLQSRRLLQLVTDAEAAQYGFLVTRDDQYLTQFTAARSEALSLEESIKAYFASTGATGAQSAQLLIDLSDKRFVSIGQVMQLAKDGRIGEATDLAKNPAGRDDMAVLRKAFADGFALSAAQQRTARVSIFDALLIQRVAVGSLTLVSLLSLFLFLRQLMLRERSAQAQQKALLMERQRLEVQVKRRTLRLSELATHLQTVSEAERANLARELHDELGGILTVSKLEIARARTKVGEPEELLKRLDRINAVLNEGISLKRRIIEDLRPSALTHLGLAIAMQNLCEEMSDSIGVPIRLSMEDAHLSPDADLAVYRFVQEALTNIAKYAHAKNVDVRLQLVSGKAVVSIRDDGAGFDLKRSRAGQHGLTGMQFRAESLGGSMHVSSTPGMGTTVSIEFNEVQNPTVDASFNSGWQSLEKPGAASRD